jgi:uncharacterized RDD family membrane protein YckC
MALTMALGQIRLLASDGKGRFAEQLYDVSGTPTGTATEAVTAPSAIDKRVANLLQLILIAVLFVWMMGALRQRPQVQEAVRRLDQLNLAPLGRRVAGGLIDALPIFIAMFIAERTIRGAAPAATVPLTYRSPELVWIAAGVGLYFLHTTIFELLFMRTIGKFITGTRVTSLDLSRPRASAILTRNLLRLVDLVLVFPPLFIFFSPLRQRVGDMAAGTLVVRDGQAPATPLDLGSERERGADD